MKRLVIVFMLWSNVGLAEDAKKSTEKEAGKPTEVPVATIKKEDSKNEKKLLFSHMENAHMSRVVAAILSKAYEEIGYKVEYTPLPFERSLIEANAGRTDGEIHRLGGLSKEYTNLVQIPVVLFKSNLNAFSVRKDLKLDKSWESLRPYHFGIMNGQKISEMKTKDMPNRTVFTDQEEALKAVSEGHFDLVVLSELTGLELLASKPNTKIQCNYPPIDTALLYHYLNKKYEAIVPQITQKLQEYEKSGFIEKMNAELGSVKK